MADAVTRVTWVLETIDRASQPMLAADRRMRTAIAGQEKALASQGKVAADASAKTGAAATRMGEQTSVAATRSTEAISKATGTQTASLARLAGMYDKLAADQLRLAETGGKVGLAASRNARQYEAEAVALRKAEVAQNAYAASADRAAVASGASGASATRRGGLATGAAGGAGVASALKGTVLGLAAIGAVSGKMATQFDASMERVHTQAGATQKEVDRLRGSVLNLAGTKVSQGPQQLAEGLYHLESVGLHGAKAMDTLKVAAEGAAVGNSNLEDTASALGGAWLTNIKGAGNLHHVMALLNATVGAGNVRMGDLVQALGTGVLPAAKVAGLGIKDVFGALTVFTDENMNASQSMAQFATSLHFLYSPTSKAAKALKTVGLSSTSLAQDMHKPQGLLTALQDLKTHLDTLPGGLKGIQSEQVLGAILPGGRGRILITLLNQLDRYQMKMNQISRTSSKFGEDLLKTQETPAYKIHAAWSLIQADMIRLGGVVLPIAAAGFSRFAQVVSVVGKTLAEHRTLVKLLVGSIAALGAAWTGLKVVEAISKINASLTGLAGKWGLVRTSATEATVAEETAGRVGVAGGGGAVGGLRGAAGKVLGRAGGALAVGIGGYTAAQLAGTAIGGRTGKAVGTIGGTAAMGAGIGMFAGPMGALSGAVVGGLAGGFETFLKGKAGAYGRKVGAEVTKGLGGAMHAQLQRSISGEINKTHDTSQAAKNKAGQALMTGKIDTKQFNAQLAAAAKQESASYRKIGVQVAKAMEDGWKGYKFLDVGTMLAQFTRQFGGPGVKVRTQRAVAEQMITYAAEMVKDGRLPKSAVDNLIASLELKYKGLTPILQREGYASMTALQRTLSDKRVLGTAKNTMNLIAGTIQGLPKVAKITGQNAAQVFRNELSAINTRLQTATGTERRLLLSFRSQVLRDQAAADKVMLGNAIATFSNMKTAISGLMGALGSNVAHTLSRIASMLAGLGGPLGNAISGLQQVAHAKSPKAAAGGLGSILGSILGGGHRAGGKVRRYADGGMVLGAVSPGEQIVYGNQSWMVPGARTAADSVVAPLPVGAEVYTASGQQMLAGGASPAQALAAQLPHFASGGRVPAGRYEATAYGPPWNSMEGYGITSTGVSLKGGPKRHIVAVDPSVIPYHSKVFAWPNPFSWRGPFMAEDTGGAIKGRHLDFYDWLGRSHQNNWGRREVTVSNRSVGGSSSSSSGGGGRRLVAAGKPGHWNAPAVTRPRLVNIRQPSVPDAFTQGFQGGVDGGGLFRATSGLDTDLFKQAVSGASPTQADLRTWTKPVAAKYAAASSSSMKVGGGSKSFKMLSGSGVGNWHGVRVANWLINALRWAQAHGGNTQVTSGYRPGFDSHTASGRSEHQGTKYPHGAIDFGGFTTGLAHKLSFLHSLRGYPGPKPIMPQGFRDDGHTSGTGHRRGGVIRRFRSGGLVVGSPRVESSVAPRAPGLPHPLSLARLVAQIQAAGTTATALAVRELRSLGSLVENAGRVSYATLGRMGAHIRVEITKLAKRGLTGAERVQTRRLQAALTLVDSEMGKRLGHVVAVFNSVSTAIDDARTQLSRNLAVRGIDEASAGGLLAINGYSEGVLTRLGTQRKKLEGALAKAKRARQPDAVKQIQDALTQVTGQIGDTFVTIVQNVRAAIEAAAQDKVDTASFGSSLVQGGLQSLDLQQQVAGTHDTAAGGAARASYITNAEIPFLTAELRTLQAQVTADQKAGDVAGMRAAALAAQQKTNDILQAKLDAISANTAQTADNTDTLKQFGGQLAFQFQGQSFTDDLLSAGVGA